VEAGQNKTFLKVDVTFNRKKGIAAAELPTLPRTSIDDWGVRVPKTPLAGGAGRSADPSATLDLVSREPTTRGGVKGLAFHFNVRIANARGRKCTLMGAFFDNDHHLVRSANPSYAVPPDDILMLTVVLTPKSDDEEIRDVELFLPGDALPGGPGQHVFQFLPQVYLDEPLVKDPKFHEVKITRR